MSVCARGVGLVLGYAADLAFADPRRGHPVAGFGVAASALERVCWADERPRGAAYTGALVGGIAALGWAAQRATRGRPMAEVAIVATATRAGADCVVIASHGESGLRRAVFGSVAESVVRSSRTPVLIVRPAYDI